MIIYAAVMTLALMGLFLTTFTHSDKIKKFKEIDAD